jgi:hypothetical protein
MKLRPGDDLRGLSGRIACARRGWPQAPTLRALAVLELLAAHPQGLARAAIQERLGLAARRGGGFTALLARLRRDGLL